MIMDKRMRAVVVNTAVLILSGENFCEIVTKMLFGRLIDGEKKV